MAAGTLATRNIAAEVRAIEEGHRARLDTQAHEFLVKSDTTQRTYQLRAQAVDGLIVVSCTCPAGVKGSQRPRGVTLCKHAALVCRRLERAELAEFVDGLWRVTHQAERLVGAGV